MDENELKVLNMFAELDSANTAQNNNNTVLATDTTLVDVNRFRRLPATGAGKVFNDFANPAQQWYLNNLGGTVRALEGLSALGSVSSTGIALALPETAPWAIPLSTGLGYASAGAGILDTWALPGLSLSERFGRTSIDALGFIPLVGNSARVAKWAAKYPRTAQGLSYMLPKTPTNRKEILVETLKRPTTSYALQYEIPGIIEQIGEDGALSSNIMSRGFENFGRDWHDAFAGTTEEQSIAAASNLVNFGTSMFMGRPKITPTQTPPSTSTKRKRKVTGNKTKDKSTDNKTNELTNQETSANKYQGQPRSGNAADGNDLFGITAAAGLTTAATANASPKLSISGNPTLKDYSNNGYKKGDTEGSIRVFAKDNEPYDLTIEGLGDNIKYVLSDGTTKWKYSPKTWKLVSKHLNSGMWGGVYATDLGDGSYNPNPRNNFGMKPKNLNGGKLNSLKSLRV